MPRVLTKARTLAPYRVAREWAEALWRITVDAKRGAE